MPELLRFILLLYIVLFLGQVLFAVWVLEGAVFQYGHYSHLIAMNNAQEKSMTNIEKISRYTEF